MAGRKPITQEEFNERLRRIKESVLQGHGSARRRATEPRMNRSRRQVRDHSPLQTIIAVDRDLYEFVRRIADRDRISLKSALSKLLRPVMEACK